MQHAARISELLSPLQMLRRACIACTAIAVLAACFLATPAHAAATGPADADLAVLSIRDDYSLHLLSSKDGFKAGRLPYLVRNDTTGEQHVAISDEDGRIDTSTQDYANEPNGNDFLLGCREIDTSSCSDSDLWFECNADGSKASPAPGTGALSFGVYTIRELRCEANADRKLLNESFFIYDNMRHSRYLETAAAASEEALSLSTRLCDAADGDQIVLAGTNAACTCKIECDLGVFDSPADVSWVVLDARTWRPVHARDGTVLAGRITLEGTPQGASSTICIPWEAAKMPCGQFRVQSALIARDGTFLAASLPSEADSSVSVVGIDCAISSGGEGGSYGESTASCSVSVRGLEPRSTYHIVADIRARAEDGSGKRSICARNFETSFDGGYGTYTFTLPAKVLEGIGKKQLVVVLKLERAASCESEDADGLLQGEQPQLLFEDTVSVVFVSSARKGFWGDGSG